jgi:hypothetical protein
MKCIQEYNTSKIGALFAHTKSQTSVTDWIVVIVVVLLSLVAIEIY